MTMQLPSPDDDITTLDTDQSTSTELVLDDEEDDNGLWCYCRQDRDYDVMIAYVVPLNGIIKSCMHIMLPPV